MTIFVHRAEHAIFKAAGLNMDRFAIIGRIPDTAKDLSMSADRPYPRPSFLGVEEPGSLLPSEGRDAGSKPAAQTTYHR